MSTEALIDALVGYGWDRPHEPDLATAAGLLQGHPQLSSSNVYISAATADLPALRAHLAADPESATRSGGPRDWPPLLYAAYSHAHQLEGRQTDITEAVRVLLEAGADPNTAYFHPDHDNGFSALYATVAITAHRPRTDLLLAAGAQPSDGNTTYHAVETFDLDLLEALGAAGIDPDDLSYTLKHILDLRWKAATRLFLDLGADPNAVHPAADETTLHWAVKRAADAETLGWLLDAGADPMARTREGRAGYLPLLGHTPVDTALRLGHTEAVALFEAAGATQPPSTPALDFVHAVARGDTEAVDALLADRPDVAETLPDEDRCLLPLWAQHGRQPAVDLALRTGAFPVHALGWMHLQALHWAALRGDPGMVKTLLDAGAPATDLGPGWGTPSDIATNCQWYDGDYKAVLELLGSTS